MSTTIRVSEDTRKRVAEIAAATGQQMQTIVDEAVAAYERAMFWQAFETGYAELADDPERWATVEVERAGEESVLGDEAR